MKIRVMRGKSRYTYLSTYDIVYGGVVAAGDEVGEKVDHHQTLLLSLRTKDFFTEARIV